MQFTVDGIGLDSTRKNEDGTTENLCAYLIGIIGINSVWSPDENGNASVMGEEDTSTT